MKVREHIEDTCDYVGDGFADEARAIQSGDAEQRPIYGEASNEEATELEEEGVEFERLSFPIRSKGKLS